MPGGSKISFTFTSPESSINIQRAPISERDRSLRLAACENPKLHHHQRAQWKSDYLVKTKIIPFHVKAPFINSPLHFPVRFGQHLLRVEPEHIAIVLGQDFIRLDRVLQLLRKDFLILADGADFRTFPEQLFGPLQKVVPVVPDPLQEPARVLLRGPIQRTHQHRSLEFARVHVLVGPVEERGGDGSLVRKGVDDGDGDDVPQADQTLVVPRDELRAVHGRGQTRDAALVRGLLQARRVGHDIVLLLSRGVS